MRFLTAIVFVVGVTAAVRAHFVFVYVDGSDAKIVFGHAAAPDPKASVARCEKTILTARDSAGKETRLAVEKGDGSFYQAKLPAEKPRVVFGTTDAGVTQYAENPPVLSWYYPKVITGDPFAKGTEAATPLEVVPVRDGDGVRFKVLHAGKPAEGIEVTVGLSGRDEDKAKATKTDKNGMTEGFAEKGRYCVAARRTDEKPGELAGKKYAAVRHIATLVFDFGAEGK